MMRTAMLATASAIAFAFAIGTVSAADFTTLKGVKAVPMSAVELSTVRGMDHHFFVNNPSSDTPVRHNTDQHQDAIGPGGKGENFVDLGFVNSSGQPILVAPSYTGLQN